MVVASDYQLRHARAGSALTPAVSRDRLDAALAVPVNIRSSSNALPSYAEISLQSVIQNFPLDRQVEILQTRLRVLQLVQLRLTPALAPVAGGYANVLADYLGQRQNLAYRHPPGPAATLKQLNELDVRRREVEFKLKLNTPPADSGPNSP